MIYWIVASASAVSTLYGKLTGEDHLPWAEIAAGLRDAAYAGQVVIEAITPKIKEIARAASLWCPLAESEDALARNRLRHLRQVFA